LKESLNRIFRIIPNRYSEGDSENILTQPYLPSLDGFRAVSILLVIGSHARLGFELGGLGVKIFFVISGFLITTLLLKEKSRNGIIDLKKFYIRRALRILPVAYLFIGVVFLLRQIYHFNMPNIYFLTSLLFLEHFNRNGATINVGHFWSLSVEEQFYLVFPFLLKWNFKFYLYFLLAFLFFVTLLDFYNLNPQQFPKGTIPYYSMYFLLPFRDFDGIILGSLMAIFLFNYSIKIAKEYFIPIKIILHILLVPLLIILFISSYSVNDFMPYYLNNLWEVILIGVLIWLNLSPSKDPIYWLLNSRLFKQIGLLSYSLYIWQQIFTITIPWKSAFPYGDYRIVNLTALVLVACLSYYFYERKFLKIKTRFH